MNLSTDQLNQISTDVDHYIPGYSVNCVIFGFEDQKKIKVLILELKEINMISSEMRIKNSWLGWIKDSSPPAILHCSI
jgi:hypothetical protein